eukprot:scaffold51743_cov76-Phaeocystis_antarctica.AAC.2
MSTQLMCLSTVLYRSWLLYKWPEGRGHGRKEVGFPVRLQRIRVPINRQGRKNTSRDVQIIIERMGTDIDGFERQRQIFGRTIQAGVGATSVGNEEGELRRD